jgi:5-methylcytosine-specific restriction protein A
MPADPFYRSTTWRRFRASALRARPICASAGCGAIATHLDHIVPRRRGGADLDRSNVQALCPSCHATKTAVRDGGFGRPGRPDARLRLSGCDATGLPRDPAHPWRAPDGRAAGGEGGIESLSGFDALPHGYPNLDGAD